MTVGTRVKEWREKRQLSVPQLAGRVGLAPSTLYDIERGDQKGSTKLHRIAEELGLYAAYLETGKGPAERAPESSPTGGELEAGPAVGRFRAVPIVGTASMGEDGYWYEFEYPVGHGDGFVDVPTMDPNAYALRLKGQSMFPAIRDGWFAVVEPNNPLQVGEYVYAKTKKGQCMVKELLWHRNGEYALESVNKDFGRVTILDDDLELIHYIGSIAPPSKRRL